MDENKKVELYINEMMRIKNQKEQEALEADMEQIAKELGFDAEELEKIEEERLRMVSMGLQFVKHQQADDAIEVLLKAYNLKSRDEKTLQYLAQAHATRFVQTNEKKYIEKMEHFATACLQVNPKNEVCYKIIQSVQHERDHLKASKVKRLKRYAWLGGIILLITASIYGISTQKESNSTTQEDKALITKTKTKQTTQPPIEIDQNGKPLVLFEGDQPIKIYKETSKLKVVFTNPNATQTELTYRVKGAKNKYYIQGKELITKHYAGEQRFKIKTAEGKELYKIKVYDQKVKISDQVKGTVFQLKQKEENKIKAYKDDQEVGFSKPSDGQKVKIKKEDGTLLYTVTNGKAIDNRYSFALLSLQDLPVDIQMIILTELTLLGL